MPSDQRISLSTEPFHRTLWHIAPCGYTCCCYKIIRLFIYMKDCFINTRVELNTFHQSSDFMESNRKWHQFSLFLKGQGAFLLEEKVQCPTTRFVTCITAFQVGLKLVCGQNSDLSCLVFIYYQGVSTTLCKHFVCNVNDTQNMTCGVFYKSLQTLTWPKQIRRFMLEFAN